MIHLIFNESECTCIYVEEDTYISVLDIIKWFEKATNTKVRDLITETQDNLQYYCIDGRVWVAKNDVQKILNYIKD